MLRFEKSHRGLDESSVKNLGIACQQKRFERSDDALLVCIERCKLRRGKPEGPARKERPDGQSPVFSLRLAELRREILRGPRSTQDLRPQQRQREMRQQSLGRSAH